MSEILIDSNILIDISKGDTRAAEFINNHLSKAVAVNISAITAMEVLFGSRHKKDQRLLEQLLAIFNPLKVSEDIGDLALGLIKTYSLSNKLNIPDALIAATALSYNLPIYTSNKKHFQMIKHLKVIKPY